MADGLDSHPVHLGVMNVHCFCVHLPTCLWKLVLTWAELSSGSTSQKSVYYTCICVTIYLNCQLPIDAKHGLGSHDLPKIAAELVPEEVTTDNVGRPCHWRALFLQQAWIDWLEELCSPF